MGVPWDDEVVRSVCLHQNRALDLLETFISALDGSHHPEANVRGNLIIATASRVEFAGDCSDDLAEPTPPLGEGEKL